MEENKISNPQQCFRSSKTSKTSVVFCLSQLPDEILEKILLFLLKRNTVECHCGRKRMHAKSGDKHFKNVFKLFLVSKVCRIAVQNALVRMNMTFSVDIHKFIDVPRSVIALLPAFCLSWSSTRDTWFKPGWFGQNRFDAVSCFSLDMDEIVSKWEADVEKQTRIDSELESMERFITTELNNLKHVALYNSVYVMKNKTMYVMPRVGLYFRHKKLESFKLESYGELSHLTRTLWSALNGSKQSLKSFTFRCEARILPSKQSFPDLSTFSSLKTVVFNLPREEDRSRSPQKSLSVYSETYCEKYGNQLPFSSMARSQSLEILELCSDAFDFSLLWKIKSLKRFCLVIVHFPSYREEDFNLNFQENHDLASLSPFAWCMIQLDRAAHKFVGLERFELNMGGMMTRVFNKLSLVAEVCQRRTGINVTLLPY